MRIKTFLLTTFAFAVAGTGGIQSAPCPQAANAESSQTYFEKDPRLKVSLTARSPAWTHLRLWSALYRKTGVPLEREEGASEFDDNTVALGFNGVSARAVMDAAAARVLARWERTERNGYRLPVPQRELDFVFLAKNEHQRELFGAGVEFIRDLSALPQEEQARIGSGQFIPFASLPANMQRSVGQMLQALSREFQERDRAMGSARPPIPFEDLPSANFRVERQPANGFNRLALTVRFTSVRRTTGWSINDYEQQKQAREAARRRRPAGELDALYAPRKFEVSQEEAKRLPALQKRITLSLANVTFPEVLQRLHAKYGLAFLSDPTQHMPQKATIRLVSVPLGEALDRLTEIYQDTEWEWRKYGVLIVRGPSNPARDPRQIPSVQGETTMPGKPAPPKAAP